MEWFGIIRKLEGKLEKFWLAMAFILVSALSFEAGSIQQAIDEPKPVIVEVPATISPAAIPERQPIEPGVSEAAEHFQKTNQDCAFVGSKNSNKYHTPASRCAKQIKPENLVCFTSTEAAIAKGYHTGCIE
ncbi:MAG: hypothetical protein E6Q06_01665 [Candidatus Moraniibacteriota bacterium]|nr:MAG: hypothetical protein E6Q06_01665 [Candidatus Moranbacteria bacterium]